MITKGLIYIATGSQYRAEASSNLERSRPFLQSFRTCIFTDDPFDPNISSFDLILKHPCPTFGYRDKILPLLDLPFDHNLFLDSDAFLIYSSSALFDLLDHFDFVASQAPVRHPSGWSDMSIPLTFPEFNSGVLLLNKGIPCQRLVESWIKLYDHLYSEFSQQWDQSSLRSSVWTLLKSNLLNTFVLPPECNLRTTKPWIIGRGMPAYVVHGRVNSEELHPFISYLNDDIDRFRYWTEWLQLFPESSIRPRYDRSFN